MYFSKDKLIIIMVGLPARGKSYIANNLAKYFRWNSYNSKIFNVGNYRRIKLVGFQNHSFFDNKNEKEKALRDSMAFDVFNELLEWINNETSNIAIFDATNTRIERRNDLIDLCKNKGYEPLFIESICSDESLINSNLQLKLISKDYTNVDKDFAINDFKNRLQHYEKIYVEITDKEDIKYIKLINKNKKIKIYKINTFLERDTVNYLINLGIKNTPIYLSRHGQSNDNILGKLGGDSTLSILGQKYIEALDIFFTKEKLNNLQIYTSILKRTIETSSKMSPKYKTNRLKLLNEINAGICEGLTYEGVKNKYPEIYNSRKLDKFNYRYPEGESYKDIVDRVKPFILELERIEEPILVISHNAITRVIYAYLMDIPQKEIPHFDIPLHTVIKLIPTSTGYYEERIQLIK